MTCSGKNVFTGSEIEITFAASIQSIAALARATDWHLAPAWIDLQVNGFAGVDYNDPAAPLYEIGRSIRTLFATGVARFYPTVITAAPSAMEAALRNLSSAKDALPEGAAIEGFHVEGPHISPEDGPRGAHPRTWVRKPDLDEFRRWQEATQNRVRIVTLSPEWPGAAGYISGSSPKEWSLRSAIRRPPRPRLRTRYPPEPRSRLTWGNGAHAVLPRFNYIWEQLAEDRLMAGFIVDGIHLPETFLRVALRAKGIERTVLVTDAVAPAGCAPGRYRLGELAVELTSDGRVTLAGQPRLAGSALRMDRAIENLIRLAHVSLGDAVRMATMNAAKAGRVSGRQLGLAPGDCADLVQFRFDPQTARMEIGTTWLAGREVYRNSASAPR